MKRILVLILCLWVSVCFGAYEDFTTFTENDPGNDITVDSATKVSWVDLDSRNDPANVYKDYTAAHFASDHTHQFEMQFDNAEAGALVGWYQLSNATGDIKQLVDASEDFVVLYYYGLFRLRIYDGGSATDTDDWTSEVAGTTYYVTITRDRDGGANSTGQYLAYIRTGSHTGNLEDTLSVDCKVGGQVDWRYLSVVTVYDSNSASDDVDGFTENLDLNEAAASSSPQAIITTIMP